MRIVFLGTPEFAVPSLQALAAKHEVIGAFTQPDRPKGRGNKLAESLVKVAARELAIAVHQPERLRKDPTPELLAGFEADLMVVVGYGQIIPQKIIDLPKHGILNVHASLLPKYRGAAPIQWAIAEGEERSGVTIMQIDAGLDTGDMLLASALAIEPDETAPEFSSRLAVVGARLLIEAIAQIEDGVIVAHKQDSAEATLAPILKKEDGLIDWLRPAAVIYNRLRGFTPWPGAYTTFRGGQFSITRARPAVGGDSFRPGALYVDGRCLRAGCGNGTALELLEVQPAGKNRMPAEAFLNGYQPTGDEVLGATK